MFSFTVRSGRVRVRLCDREAKGEPFSSVTSDISSATRLLLSDESTCQLYTFPDRGGIVLATHNPCADRDQDQPLAEASVPIPADEKVKECGGTTAPSYFCLSARLDVLFPITFK